MARFRVRAPLVLALLLALSLITSCAGAPPAAPVHSPALPASARPAPPPEATPASPPFLDPAILHGTLPNGLTYYVLRREEPAGRAAVWLAVDAGSVLEDDDQRGLAHFIEHMAFAGTVHYPKHAILDFLERAGMRIGADANASTGFDQTLYQLTLPTDRDDLVPRGLDVLRDIAQNVNFDAADVDHERSIILEEWRQRRDASARARDEASPVLFAGSRYAERDPIGLTETIRTASVAALKRFYADWYRPNLMGVIAVGDFEPKAVEHAIVERFTDLENPATPRSRPVFEVPHDAPPATTIHVDPELSMSEVILLDRVERQRRVNRDDYRGELVENLYFSIVSERLAEFRDSPHSVLVRTNVRRQRLARALDAYEYAVTSREGKLDNALYLLASELVRLAHHGVLPAELERAKKELRARSEASLEESEHAPPGRKASELVRHLFESEEVPGEARELELIEELLPTITLDEVNRFARERANPAGRVVVLDVPPGPTTPSETGITNLLRVARHSELGAWQAAAAPGPLLAAQPAPGQVVSRRHDAGADADVWLLSNGVRVVAKHTKFSRTNVLVRGVQPGGTSLASDADYLDARFASGIVGSSGAGTFSQRELNTLLAGTRVHAEIELGELEQTIDARARSDELETLFQCVYLRLTQPRAEAYAFDIWKEHYLESLRHRDDVPEQRFAAEVASATTRNHLRRRHIEAAMLEHADRAKSLAIWQQRFANFEGFTFVVVGHFDPAELERLATKYLASLPSTRQKPHFKDPGITYATGAVERTIAGDVEDKARLWLEFATPLEFGPHSEADALVLERVLELRLQDVLRHELGAIYSLGVRATVTRDPAPRQALALQFTCAPANVTRLRRAVFDELAGIAKHGVSDDYLVKAREILRRRAQADAQSDAWWLGRLTAAYRHDDDFARANDIAAVLARVTNTDLQKTAARLCDPRHYVLVVMRPGGGAASGSPRAVTTSVAP